MSKEVQIRGVTVELLRAGPSHNQLLSPLTQYLAICDDAEAGVVTLPYEHEAFLRRMRSMRYEADEEPKQRLPVLREMGVEMARLLGAVPRLPGSLTGDVAGPDTLVHLRMVLSAAELAELPFELAKIPIGPAAWAEGWLSLQARVPVVITRRTRNVSAGGVRWPKKPRILFVAADPTQVPFDDHKNALLDAVRPFMYPDRDEPPSVSDDKRCERYGELLTILKNARFDEVAAECAANRYTHVHVLAHGGVDLDVEYTSYGLLLQGADGDNEVISGERFASAFACMVDGSIHRPSVVTLASCDGGNGGSVLVPGASIAHVLHQAGIPLVVASQFPLSKAGSVRVARAFYRGLLWGENPWVLLHGVRTELHSRLAVHSHDWASLVVYEALPPNLDEQLEETRYLQAKLAINAAFQRIELAVQRDGADLESVAHAKLTAAVFDACKRLPMDGRFAMECHGLRASSHKRLAEAEFSLARITEPGKQAAHVVASCGHLERSLVDYELAVNGFLVNQGQAVQRVSSLHWVLVQQLCLSAVLGKPVPDGSWETARLSADAYLQLQDAEERAWAHGSLAELWLLKLVDPHLADDAVEAAASLALRHATELLKLFRSGDAFPIQSTRMQFTRYVNWWGHSVFEQALIEPGLTGRISWRGLRLLGVAAELVAILDRRGIGARSALAAKQAAPSPRPPSPPAPSLPTPPPPSPPDAPPAPPTEPLPAAAASAAATPAPAANGNLGLNPGAGHAPAGHPSTSSGAAFFNIDMLPAGHGDCLWIEYGDGSTLHRVLIDCGVKTNYARLKERIAKLPPAERRFELFMLSHIDDDHIGAAVPLLADTALGVHYGDIWFNGWRHLPQDKLNAKQGEEFSALILKSQLNWNLWRQGQAIVLGADPLPTCTLPGGMVLTLLSPTLDKLAILAKRWNEEIRALKKTPGDAAAFLGRTVSTSTAVDTLAEAKFTGDTAPNNGSSIAVLAEYRGKRVLFGADAYSPVLEASVNKLLAERQVASLAIDAFKLPHHGSGNNLDVPLLKLLDCKHYLVSTNGKHFNHPDREAIARVIRHGGKRPKLWFNYTTPLNDVWARADLQSKWNYDAEYPAAGQEGLLFQV